MDVRLSPAVANIQPHGQPSCRLCCSPTPLPLARPPFLLQTSALVSTHYMDSSIVGGQHCGAQRGHYECGAASSPWPQASPLPPALPPSELHMRRCMALPEPALPPPSPFPSPQTPLALAPMLTA